MTTTTRRPAGRPSTTGRRTTSTRSTTPKKRVPVTKRIPTRGRASAKKTPATKRMPATAGGERLAAWLTLVVLGLTLFGLVMVLSASSVTSLYQLDGSPFYQFQRQAMWAVLGALAFIIMSRIDYRLLQRPAGGFLVTAIVLLVLVLSPLGQNINGSSRWLGIGPFVIQPSEVAKLALIIFCADLLTRRVNLMDRADLTIRPVLAVLAVVSALLLLQPKLGTPIVLGAVAFMMLFVAGARVEHLFAWASVGALAATFLAFSADYRRARILAFLNPWEDPQGIGLQTIQSQVGIASGGWFGVGLGAGRAKWGFLPYAHSDFIFAIVAEEVGLLGAAALILAFLALGYLGLRTAINAADRFGMLLAAGITSWLLVQAFLNIGMAIGQLPITGEPLPFVSAGGSSLVTTLAAAGVLTNVARRARV